MQLTAPLQPLRQLQRAYALSVANDGIRAILGRCLNGDVMRAISLALILFVFWLGLSGHYTPFLLSLGALSTVVCVIMAVRMQILDPEGHPILMLPRAVTYFPWLLWEILKSSFDVAKLILTPGLSISPTMTIVNARQSTPVGVATFANSITLTPGTITTGVFNDEVTVHALTREGANDVQGGRMNQRVKEFEGSV